MFDDIVRGLTNWAAMVFAVLAAATLVKRVYLLPELVSSLCL
jgi:hypothetical protein